MARHTKCMVRLKIARLDTKMRYPTGISCYCHDQTSSPIRYWNHFFIPFIDFKTFGRLANTFFREVFQTFFFKLSRPKVVFFCWVTPNTSFRSGFDTSSVAPSPRELHNQRPHSHVIIPWVYPIKYGTGSIAGSYDCPDVSEVISQGLSQTRWYQTATNHKGPIS